ncbi:MAG: sulfotransferase [Alphaproteobacteria bacterium]|nr:sulfotransferase [Alphaproteobacteria bacterium]
MTIFVLGMHRSGTSAITRLIADMGAYIGAEDEMLPPNPDNPQGFWERGDVLAINRAIMQAQHCNWYTVEHFDSRQPLPPALQRPLQACAATLAAHSPFVVKDPRFCLTLPYWLPHVQNPVIVLALRHPATIADSLHRRNNMAPEQGLALWENHMTHALKNIAGLPVVRCRFETLMENPAEEIPALHRALARHFPGLTLPSIHAINPAFARAAPAKIQLSSTQQALYERAMKGE